MAKDVYKALVEWEDSVRPQSDWQILTGKSRKKWKPVTISSLGYVVKDGGGVVVLMPNLGNIGGASVQGCGEIVIPKRSVTRMVRLKEGKNA